MGLLAWTLGLPLQPVRGVLAVGRVVQRQVELEQHSTASARRRLEQVEQARAQDPEHFDEEQEEQAMRQIIGAQIPAVPSEDGER